MKTNKYSALLILTASILITGMTSSCKKKEEDLTKAFIKYYGGINSDKSVDIHQTSDGGYIIAGTTTSEGNGASDIILLKTDAEGTEIWHRTLGGVNYDECGSVLVTPQGEYLVVGTKGKTSRKWGYYDLQLGDTTEMFVARVGKLGNVIWDTTYVLSLPSVKIGTFGIGAVAVGNQFIISGMVDSSYVTTGTVINLDLYGIKINDDGTRDGAIISEFADGADASPDVVANIVPAANGTDWVIASSTEQSGRLTPRLVQMVESGGAQLTQINAPTNHDWEVSEPTAARTEFSGQIIRAVDNNYMLVGTSRNAGNTDIFMMKVDANTLLNIDLGFYGDPGLGANDKGVSVAATSDAGYVILGTTDSRTLVLGEDKLDDVILIKTNGNGTQLWAKTFGGRGNDVASKVITTSDGGYAILGSIQFGDDPSNTGNTNTITLIKLDGNGELNNLK